MASSIEVNGPDEADDPAVRGDSLAAMNGGLSWTWDFDLGALLEAVKGAAPWLRSTPDTEDADADADADAAGADDGDAADVEAADGTADGAKDAADGTGDSATDAADGTGDSATDAADGTADCDKDAADSGAEGDAVDPEADEAEYQEALAAGRVREIPLELVAGRIAESLPTGPGLASWLAHARAADLEDGALAGVAASFHRLASWAAAGELAAVAQIASRSARSDRRAEVDAAGRPDRVTADAAGQVALALAMSHDGATSWADLGVMLTWRLPATGAALAAGEIDLARARMIVRMTSALNDEAARQVEAAVLGRAGWLTLGQLHAALRRAVIKADPDGAERRRKQSERNASVAFYPEDEGTATLAGYSLPGVEAAAAMARITALAKAMKAAGSDGQIDWLRAHVFLGLLLGTLPLTPPTPDGPADPPAPPQGQPPASPSRGAPSPGGPPPSDPSDGSAPAGNPPDGNLPADNPPAGNPPAALWPGILPYLPWETAAGQSSAWPAGLLSLAVPLETLAGTSSTPGQLSWLGVVTAGQARQLGVLAAQHPGTRWRVVVVNSAGQAIAVTSVPRSRSPGPADKSGKAGIGLIRRVTLVVPADELANGPPIGDWKAPNRYSQALGTPGGGADWRVHGSPVPVQDIDPALAMILDRAMSGAKRAAEKAAERESKDRHSGGCAHELASSAYRPPPRVAELVTARDRTCRFPPCRRPAEQCDLDHTVPFDQGGLTCTCNMGGACRSHHQLKQHPRWSLSQRAAGIFKWTTPAGRSYASRPDPYAI